MLLLIVFENTKKYLVYTWLIEVSVAHESVIKTCRVIRKYSWYQWFISKSIKVIGYAIINGIRINRQSVISYIIKNYVNNYVKCSEKITGKRTSTYMHLMLLNRITLKNKHFCKTVCNPVSKKIRISFIMMFIQNTNINTNDFIICKGYKQSDNTRKGVLNSVFARHCFDTFETTWLYLQTKSFKSRDKNLENFVDKNKQTMTYGCNRINIILLGQKITRIYIQMLYKCSKKSISLKSHHKGGFQWRSARSIFRPSTTVKSKYMNFVQIHNITCKTIKRWKVILNNLLSTCKLGIFMCFSIMGEKEKIYLPTKTLIWLLV